MSHTIFWLTVTLTSDLVLRIIVSRAYLIFFEVGIQNLVYMHLWTEGCHGPFLGHCDLDLVLIIIVYGAYLLYYLR